MAGSFARMTIRDQAQSSSSRSSGRHTTKSRRDGTEAAMNDESATDLREITRTDQPEPMPNDGDGSSDGASISTQRRIMEMSPDARDASMSGPCDGATNVVEIVGTVMQQRRTDRGRVARTLISP